MIKFLDLKKINRPYKDKFQEMFDAFLDSGMYILGNQVQSFEKEFSDYCGTKYCIGVSNGLDALHLIFEAYKVLGLIEEGDEIILPSNTYIATVLAVSKAGLKPVFVQPNIDTLNVDVHKIEAAIGKKTRGILGVHLYGLLYDFKELKTLCKKHNLLLIEDAAQAHGAKYKDGRRAGNVSDAAAFSFYPTKNLGALGDAGAITTSHRQLADVIVKLRNYGRDSTYINSLKGHNCRLDEIQAGFLRIKLKYLDESNAIRRKIAKRYFNEINSKFIQLPICENLNEHVFHLFVVRVETRDDFMKYLKANDVESAIHYPIPIYKQKAYSEILSEDILTKKICEEIVSIPLNQSLNETEVNKIITVISNYTN